MRARLLPEEIVSADNTQEGLYLRKAKELLQAYKLTQAFPGEEGKKAIITAYLNEIFYGAAYGIKAAADVYFGKDLDELTVSEAALLAAIPQSPEKFDLYNNTVKEKYGKPVKGTGKRRTRMVVKTCAESDSKCVDSELIVRRNYILGRLRDGQGRWTRLSDEQYQEALHEKITLKRTHKILYKAPHFVNALLPELNLILADRDPIKIGGYKVTTTLDWKAQQLGEKYIEAGAWLPNLPSAQYFQAIRQRRLGRDAYWISRPARPEPPQRRAGRHGLPHRRHPRLRRLGRLLPQEDTQVRSQVRPRRAGHAPARLGLEAHRLRHRHRHGALTAGTVLLDITTPFGPGWAPQGRRLDRPRPRAGPRGAAVLAEHPGHPGARPDRRQDRAQVRGARPASASSTATTHAR